MAAPGLAAPWRDAHSQQGVCVLLVLAPASSRVGSLHWEASLWQRETEDTMRRWMASAGSLSGIGSIGCTGSKGGMGSLHGGGGGRSGAGTSWADCASCCPSDTTPCLVPWEQAGTERDVFYRRACRSPRKWTVFFLCPSTQGLI